MDARQVKTAARLKEVILALAKDRPTNELTVSEVTAAAGINRSTFYQHATSPTDLLEKVLRLELDAIRAEYLTSTPEKIDPEAISLTTRAVLVHVEEHAAIYQRGLGASSGSASLHPLLSGHFAESMEFLFDRHGIELPQVAPGAVATTDLLRHSAARFIADGVVGVIDVWLRTPHPRSINDFSAVYTTLVPAWLPHTTSA